MTLVEFLLARIAEDERVVRYASVNAHGKTLYLNTDGYPIMDPRRVLAECEAKRRIIAEHGVVVDDEYSELNPPACQICKPITVAHPCPTLRLLALPYADHPDYDESWRP